VKAPKSLRRLALAVAIALCAGRAVPHGFEQYLANLDDAAIAARVNGEEMSVGRMKALLALRTPPPVGDEFLFFGVRELLEAGREAPAWTFFANEARKAGRELTDEERARIDARVRDYAERMLFREHVLNSEIRPTVESLREVYESRKDTEFTMPERFIVKEIFVPFLPNVPADDTEAKIRAFAQSFKDGVPFADLQLAAANGANVPAARIVVPDQQGEITPPEVIEAIRAVADRETTEPVKSPLGWHIVQRQLHIPKSNMPFEAVFQLLLDEWIVKKRDETIRAWFLPYAQDAELVQINTQYLLNTGGLALDRDVLVTIGGKDFTRGELAAAAGWRLNREAPLTEATFLGIIVEIGAVQQAMLDRILPELGVMDRPDVQFYRKAAGDTLIAEHMLAEEAKLDPASHEAFVAAKTRVHEKAKETLFEPLLATGDGGY